MQPPFPIIEVERLVDAAKICYPKVKTHDQLRNQVGSIKEFGGESATVLPTVQLTQPEPSTKNDDRKRKDRGPRQEGRTKMKKIKKKSNQVSVALPFPDVEIK